MRRTIAACALITVTGASGAQPTDRQLGAGSPEQTGLRPVDPGLADVNPLRMSIRRMETDLRVPLGFEGIYRLPGAPAGFGRAEGATADGQPRFARVSGALAAVFPRSEYVTLTKKDVSRTFADIPAGTVFHIGGLPRDPEATKTAPPQPGPTATGTSVNVAAPTVAGSDHGPQGKARTALDTRADVRPDPARKSAPSPPASGVCGDEAFRRTRVEELLVRAATPARTRKAAPAPGDHPPDGSSRAPAGETVDRENP